MDKQSSFELSGEPRPPEPRELKRNGHLSQLELSWERPELRQLERWEALLGLVGKLGCQWGKGQLPKEGLFQKVIEEKELQRGLRQH